MRRLLILWVSRRHRPDFKSNLVHGSAFGTPKFYIALYGKIYHVIVNLSYHWDVSISFLPYSVLFIYIIFISLKQNRFIVPDEIQVRTSTVKTLSFRIIVWTNNAKPDQPAVFRVYTAAIPSAHSNNTQYGEGRLCNFKMVKGIFMKLVTNIKYSVNKTCYSVYIFMGIMPLCIFLVLALLL